jgi:hypothetical protein
VTVNNVEGYLDGNCFACKFQATVAAFSFFHAGANPADAPRCAHAARRDVPVDRNPDGASPLQAVCCVTCACDGSYISPPPCPPNRHLPRLVDVGCSCYREFFPSIAQYIHSCRFAVAA